jgi:class 3 adenylate cyclase
VVTFLFTDVEGSTRRWETDADAMRAALAVHDEVLRSAIEAHGGFLFKHTGDGACAAFASPRSAVDAAVTAQLALELPVRMGIATGEAELRGTDYFGAVLNRTARVMAAGHAARSFWPSRQREVVSARSGVATETPSFDHAHGLPLQLSIQAERAPGLAGLV